MKNIKSWIDIALLNLIVVALLGITIRCKILFPLDGINYVYLLNAHSHFAFAGWVTLALMSLMVFKMLPETMRQRKIYAWVLGGIVLTAYGMLLSFPFQGYGPVSTTISTLCIFITYIFGWVFIKDIRKAGLDKTVLLLAIGSVVCLILSSIGPFGLAFLMASHSGEAILYRDSLFTYLHLQYNGFFTLGVFALLFHKLSPRISDEARKNIHRFSVWLVISVIPSLFLSFLWQDPHNFLLVMAILGSILVLLSACLFIISAFSIRSVYKTAPPLIRFMGLLSMGAFTLKMFLQCLTIFPALGNAVFGDRPIIIGFLHLVFLVFVSTFLLAYFASENFIDIRKKITQTALSVFVSGILFNELALMVQGLRFTFIKSSHLASSLLGAAIWMFIGAFLVGIARRMTNAEQVK